MRKKAVLLAAALLLCTIMGGCQNGTAPQNADPALSLTNEEGKTLYLGMPRADCESALGIPLENGWRAYTEAGMLGVWVQDDRVVGMGLFLGDTLYAQNPNAQTATQDDAYIPTGPFGGTQWQAGIGAATGMQDADVRALMGEPDEEASFWDFEMEGEPGGPHGYKYVLRYNLENENQAIFTFAESGGLLWLSVVEKTYTAQNFLGTLSYLAVGRGNQTLEDITYYTDGVEVEAQPFIISTVELAHTGTGPFRVVATGGGSTATLADATGSYRGGFAADIVEGRAIEVEAEGDWTVRMRTYLPVYESGRGFSDDGSYTPYTSGYVQGGGRWQVRYSGNGPFTVTLRCYSYAALAAEQELVLLETQGPYEGELEVPEGSLALFVVQAQGEWSLTPVE